MTDGARLRKPQAAHIHNTLTKRFCAFGKHRLWEALPTAPGRIGFGDLRGHEARPIKFRQIAIINKLGIALENADVGCVSRAGRQKEEAGETTNDHHKNHNNKPEYLFHGRRPL